MTTPTPDDLQKARKLRIKFQEVILNKRTDILIADLETELSHLICAAKEKDKKHDAFIKAHEAYEAVHAINLTLRVERDSFREKAEALDLIVKTIPKERFQSMIY